MRKPAPTSTRDTAADDRTRILSGAQSHFLTHGFRNVTMDELATELGMSKKTLYVHFQSKTELLEAMLDFKLQHLQSDLEKLMAIPGIPFAERLQRLLSGMRAHMEEIQPAFIRDVQRGDPKLFLRIQQARKRLIHSCFGQLLEEGRKAGAVRADIPVRLLIEMLVGAVDSMVQPARIDELGITPKTAYAQIVSVFLEGALVRKEMTK
ncbi:MAG: TetR/AcrR family transcriptional regulator [Verrucomicrobiota bacterium]|nr:TetR/AcrR family transcriptional regulator [Verrucomicrobiota bacterium]